jgi:hypothetical protein
MYRGCTVEVEGTGESRNEENWERYVGREAMTKETPG